ncbi:MAG TPA: cation diffusion facilitator family transporter [Gemmatimonadales bacterium]
MNAADGGLQRATKLAKLGLVTNAFLALAKGVAGILGHSYALTADAAESAADVGGSLIVWSGLRVSARSPDYDHPYGHGKAEPLAAAAVGLMLCGAALGIMGRALPAVFADHGAPAPFTLGVLVLVIAIKATLFRTVLRAADDVGSGALAADAWHHRADVVTSGAALVGITATLLGGARWAWCDGAAGAVASIVVFLNGLHIVRPALHELMDGAPDTALLDRVAVAARGVSDVRLVEQLKVRKFGARYLVDLHAQADPQMSLDDAHVLSGRIKTAIREAVPSVQDVLVHMEPFDQGRFDTPGTL